MYILVIFMINNGENTFVFCAKIEALQISIIAVGGVKINCDIF